MTNTALCETEAAQTAHPVELRGRDILCFSHDWTGDPLSKTHLMRLLARHNRILWVNSIGYRMPTASKADVGRAFKKLAAVATPICEVESNIFVLNPLAIPSCGRFWVRTFNQHFLARQVRRAMRKLGFRDALNWVFNPAAAVIAGRLGEQAVIYYCVDEYTVFSGVDTSALHELEHRLLKRADLVIVSAERLYRSKSQVNPRTFLVRHGVDVDHFRRALATETAVPAEIAALPRPVIGYFGLMAKDWVDVELLSRIAKGFAHGSLVLLGSVTTDLGSLPGMPNVHLLGRRPYAELPAYCKGFDVGIIPFPLSEVTLNANPLKAREYLAAGLPVVSTAIPEVEALGCCRVASDHDDFVRGLEEALRDSKPRWDRSEWMSAHSWHARLAEVTQHLSGVLSADAAPRSVRSAVA